jgi:hypothetical protein
VKPRPVKPHPCNCGKKRRTLAAAIRDARMVGRASAGVVGQAPTRVVNVSWYTWQNWPPLNQPSIEEFELTAPEVT